ncbi:hypothetical protein [Sphingobium boeckii]|uniref:Uncharacterized protein n=1 Tax=Sphingobium boeckii TaxID=1082345 RepID=A0A7W9ALC9_9SPHN|nr:hypothetical protein [Sphingobium boeckii]MBB5687549.1 hypothetical protein [Sphingobium boeckii]
MVFRCALLPLILTLVACGGYPRDPDGTLDRVHSQHVFRVGLIASGGGPDAERFIKRIADVTHARPEIRHGGTEPLLLDLERGALDLVIGELADDSPWRDRVTIIEPLAERGTQKQPILLNPIARNGENAWIMLLEREARNSGGPKP